MRSMPKFFNMLVQTWNTLFFIAVGLGGIYLLTQSSYLWGGGAGGAMSAPGKHWSYRFPR